MSDEKQLKLLEALNNCATECNRCATECLNEENVKMMVNCIKFDMDCADICTLVARMLARESQHAKHLLKECIEICNACAEECEKHAHHHDHCKRCAEACRACVAACTEYTNG
ncbi:MAG: four-helix bundle copper-binding protein [Moraxellaceae bacterium]|nr:MAG: four-helix bundle copper-binding protein [Moraxellaceae bacterium]